MGDVVKFPGPRKMEGATETSVALTITRTIDGTDVVVHENSPSTERQNDIERMVMRAAAIVWGDRRDGAVAMYMIARDGTVTTWVQPEHLETDAQRAWLRRQTARALEDALRDEVTDEQT